MDLETIAKLSCAECGQHGVAVWAERLHPVFKYRELETLSRGFILVDAGKKGDPHFECAACRVPVHQPITDSAAAP